MSQTRKEIFMSQEENNETYDLMTELERLESLREDLAEVGLPSLTQVEGALALLTPGPDPAMAERHAALLEIRQELRSLGLTDLASLEARIDQLNNELDELDDEDDED